ncbi:glycosyltransferase [Acidianus sp. HS-5]|uniref:glycosyltransferase n=1 Tax=Acidianus sp. HS-5 TaxID=2886040 RepID=UPI001F2A7A4B|nr:glycosyltransferase [Acidianus sp. HS-5]BDC18531.1 mannosyltransferase [Acidianus sp. HS-5]
MKVLLIASMEDFSGDISKVTGIGRYTREVYKRLKKEINAEQYPLFERSSAISLFTGILKGFFRDYSNYDIIHLLAPKPFFPIRKGKIKWITTAHDLFFLKYRDSKPPLIQRVYLESIMSSDAVIAVSSLIKDEVKKLGYKRRIFVVNPGVSEEFFTPLKRNKGEGKVIKLGYIGKLDSERKDVIRGIEVFKKLRDRNVVFELWGNYNPRSEVFKKIMEESEKDKRIRIMGPAPDDKIIEIYDSFDAFFFPTKEEGFGLPIVEAQARGIPVIVFKDARIPQEVCKYCLKIEDELPSLDNILSFGEKYGEKLREYASKFSWGNSIKEIINAYNSLLQSSH